MMYHLSSFLDTKEQVVVPETKHELSFKQDLCHILYSNFTEFCRLYSSNEYAIEIKRRLGWEKSKLFCECIFEYTRQVLGNENLFPRMKSFYLSKSLDEIEAFKQYANRTGTIFEVDLDVESCQKYDMTLFTQADRYLARQYVLSKDVFDMCCAYANRYWNCKKSDKPMIEYLYYGEIKIKPFINQ